MVNSNVILVTFGIVLVMLVIVIINSGNMSASKPRHELSKQVSVTEKTSQLVLIYRLRRTCSTLSTAAMFKAMDKIQDELVVNLALQSEECSSEAKNQTALVLSAIADSERYGYGHSISYNTTEASLHEKAKDILLAARKEYEESEKMRLSDEGKSVTRLTNVKAKGFYTSVTNDVDRADRGRN